MKILISCSTMTYLSGSPLYNYTLAMELAKEHDVSFCSVWVDNYLKKNLEKAGVKIREDINGDYDVALVSQQKFGRPNVRQ